MRGHWEMLVVIAGAAYFVGEKQADIVRLGVNVKWLLVALYALSAYITALAIVARSKHMWTITAALWAVVIVIIFLPK